MTFWIFASLTALGTLIVLWGEWKDSSVRFLAKPLASLGFLGAALTRGALDSSYGKVMLVGLSLAAAGDIFLMKKGLFLAGLVSFLLGHIVYVIAFVMLGLNTTWAAVAAIVVVAVGLVVVRWLWPHLTTEFQIPVVAYVIVICVMVVVALAAVGRDASPSVAFGAMGFWLSDVAVARDRFVSPSIVNRLWGLPLYYGAQLLLAWSIGS